jgi:hypothetical protein
MLTGNGLWYVFSTTMICLITNVILSQCLVGPDQKSNEQSARGVYNISIHQSYRLNGTNYYTIFDLPINVSNSIPLNASSQQNGNNPAPGPRDANGGRSSCSSLDNPLLDYNKMMQGTKIPSTQPYIGGPVLVGNYNGFNGNPKSGMAFHNDIPITLLILCLGANLIFWRR